MRKSLTIVAIAAALLLPGGVMAAWAGSADLAYLAQQALNAAVVGAFYGLLATSYALIYGITGRIMLAFGDFAAFAGYTSVISMIFIVEVAQLGVGPALAIVPVCAAAATAALGAASQSVIFAPLYGRAGQAILVASVGVAIIVQEVLRIATGGREQWLAPVLSQPYVLGESGGFSVQVTAMQILILAVSAGLSLLLLAVMHWTGFGRMWRACSQDGSLARLCGVNVPGVIAATFVLAAAYASVTGLTVAVYYGGVSFYMGLMLGLKALIAAIIGGFGSVGGALLGALLLAVAETLWSAYFDIEYRDVAVFGLFVLVLILRPEGLIRTASRPDVAI